MISTILLVHAMALCAQGSCSDSLAGMRRWLGGCSRRCPTRKAPQASLAESLALLHADDGKPGALTIVHISDTHGHHRQLNVPEGDILVHSGDVMPDCGPDKAAAVLRDFNEWLDELPHAHKILVPGNHDAVFDPERYPEYSHIDPQAILTNCKVLIDEACTVGGIKFYGYNYCSPLPGHNAFARTSEQRQLLAAKLAQQQGVDILVSHGPPKGKLDRAAWDPMGWRPCGCEYLMDAVRQMKPAFHLFGHLHEGYGITSEDGTVFINGASVNLLRKPGNHPWSFPFQPRSAQE